MIAVIDHQARHAAVNTLVLAGDETCLVRGEEERSVCDVHGIADAAAGLLKGVWPLIDRICRINLPGGNGIHANLSA